MRAGDSGADKRVAAVEVFLDRDVPNQGRTAGKTDRPIVCELLEAQGAVPISAAPTKVLGTLDSLSIKEINQYPVSCNPRVIAVLEMASSAGSINGLLTGNTPA